MEDLRRFLDTITLCLKRYGVNRDIRRVILTKCILDEYMSRHLSNCVGPAYSALSSMMLRREFAQDYIIRISQEASIESKPPQGLMAPVLMTRAGTDFILETGLLSSEQLPPNHPSENLGICNRAVLSSLVIEYISRNNLANPTKEFKKYFRLDERLQKLLETYATQTEKRDRLLHDGIPHLKFDDIIKIVHRGMCHPIHPRVIDATLKEKLDHVGDYVIELKNQRVA